MQNKIFENIVYINNIKLTTSDQIPYMYKPIYKLNPNICIRFKQYKSWNYSKEVAYTLYKLEENFLIEVIKRNFPRIPKSFNKLIGYNYLYLEDYSNKKIINCCYE